MEYFFEGLIKISFYMSIIAIVYMAINSILKKKYTAKNSYYAWLIIILGFLLPLIPELNLSPIQITIPMLSSNQVQVDVPEMKNSVEKLFVANEFYMNIATIILFSFRYIWIIGFFIIILSHIGRYCKFLRVVNRWSETIKSKEMLDIFQKIKEKMNISKKIYFKECSYISSPMMIGLVKPTIFLPAKNYSRDELIYITKHELTHFKRNDLLYKAFILFATAIHWFNPLIYKIAKKVSIQCELSCDESVIKNENLHERKIYSQTILHTATQNNRVKSILATNFYGAEQDIKSRIFSIFDTQNKKKGFTAMCALCIVVTLATTTTITFAEHIDIQWLATEYRIERENRKVAKDLLAIYEQYGLIYNADKDALFYNGEKVRFFEDKLTSDFSRTVFTNTLGTIDMLAIRNEKNELVELRAESKEEFDKNTITNHVAQGFFWHKGGW